ncbi:MAG: hypothetical protein MOGDAGHF_02131 [Rhodocyclaceae bacterium]|jgi:hypothetical protein|nr:hypothetical protein [Rhodocyclaceae bacterium]
MATDQGGIGEGRLAPGAAVGGFRIGELLHEGNVALL